jgi:hypothetical protein
VGKTSDAIAEGVSIAGAAARLTVRNRILVDTISGGGAFDREEVAGFARETLEGLADEQQRAAERMRALRRRAWGKFTTSSGTHDYRDRDTANLRRRRKQYAGVATALRTWAADSERVEALVDAARDAAWGDVEANLQRRLAVEGMTPDADPDYERMRKARMDTLRLVDLPRLASQAQRRRKRAREEADTDVEG